LAYLSYLILKPFITFILLAFVITYILYPLYKRLNKKIKNKSAAALIMALLMIVVISVPTYFITKELTGEFFVSYVLAKQFIITDFYTTGACAVDGGMLCEWGRGIANIAGNPQYATLIDAGLQRFQEYGIQYASDLIAGIPRFLLGIFIVFFTSFYLFKEGKSLVKRITKALPLKRTNRQRVVKQFDDVVFGIIYGSLITAILQGFVAFIGYLIFGIQSPVLWALATAFMALMPFIGTTFIWGPIGIFQILNGLIHNDQTLIGTGIGVLLYGTFVIAMVDNIAKPFIIGSRANVHPVTVVLGVIGGVTVFGIIGILVGPLVLALSITLIQIYELERR